MTTTAPKSPLGGDEATQSRSEPSSQPAGEHDLREKGQPVSKPYKFDSEIAWLREAARYFASRPTGGEDRAHWANVYNAENAHKLASRLDLLSTLQQGEKG